MTEKRTRALALVAEMIPGAEMSKAPAIKRFAGELATLGLDHAYGDLWLRPGLDRRARSLITVAMMIAVRDPDELRIHVPAAIRNGVTVEEIEELIYHATGYVGFPAAAAGRKVAAESLTAAGLLEG